MSGTLPRRAFLKAATVGLAAGLPDTVGAENRVLQGRRSFTMDLACGAIGVQVPLPEAVALAHQFGFEAVVLRGWNVRGDAFSFLQPFLRRLFQLPHPADVVLLGFNLVGLFVAYVALRVCPAQGPHVDLFDRSLAVQIFECDGDARFLGSVQPGARQFPWWRRFFLLRG